MSKCAFLMSSCDSYSDTWDMFYQLVYKYWADCPLPMYLNTETIRYSPSCSLELTVCNTEQGIPWGERMIRVLDMIPEKYVLLVLDDFFLQANVNGRAIDTLVDIMEKDESISSFNDLEKGYLEKVAETPREYLGIRVVRVTTGWSLALQGESFRCGFSRCLRLFVGRWMQCHREWKMDRFARN